MTDAIRLIVADDHPLFLEGLVHSLQANVDVMVIGQAADAAGASRLAREHLPDLALLDIKMPGDGLQAAREIAAACPTTRIVMLTVSEDEDDVLAALKAGASAYVLKGISARELLSVIRKVYAGEVYIAPALAMRILHEMAAPRPADPLGELTGREHDVLELASAGLGNFEIGRRLHLAEKTVKHYMTNILAKLHVRSRLEAALLAQKAGRGQESTGRR
ncbi:MAG: response regulator transcription factor [Chloroflexota bacterium]|nr:MAG: response regulator transcription factor [Chloroflexota bacterium]